ncbi:hypothetical protein ACFVFJ_48155 [Streptomyces sp. NPDC057717]|uniref:hypothetical protein n=1 Tax=Streptomyces sp. NPDC057717 TaxID=3346224 RepID=UPI0036879060
MKSTRSAQSPRDAAVVLLVELCGWLAAIVFALGCVHGWWWGGDLRNLPLIGKSAARAAAEHRGWPWVPLLVMGLGGLAVRHLWRAVAHRVFASGAEWEGRRAPRFHLSQGSC